MAHPPRKKWKSPEKIGLAAVVYGQAAITALACVVLAWIILEYRLLPNLLYRAIAVLLLLLAAVVYVPRSVRDVYDEMKRRG